MKEINLSQGKVALVDDADFDWLNQWKWYANKGGTNTWYAIRNTDYVKGSGRRAKRGILRMHRIILNTPDWLCTDHINGNGLDNRRSNLRICTKAENVRNVGVRKDSKTGYKGVKFFKLYGKYMADIRKDGKRFFLGYFLTAKEAAKAYDKAAKRLHGKFAHLNFPTQA